MSATALELGSAARMLRDALRDRSYRATPLGLEVARYYRWKKNEWGATADTMRDYEAILRNLCVYFADLELADFTPPVGTERLRECWDHYWGEKSPRTRSKVRSVWVDFFEWAIRERALYGNPARALASPKKRGVRRDPFEAEFVEAVIARQHYGADKLGVRLILEYALRRNELILVRFGDFDYEREHLTVNGKGFKFRLVPIPDEAFWGDLLRFRMESGVSPDSYLLYRTDSRRVLCREAEATETLALGNGRINHYRWRTKFEHARPVSGKTAHQWWYRCLERAGIDASTGLGMHRGRHTVASEILRASGNIVAAQKILGHESSATTEQFYAQFDDKDLARVLRTIRNLGE